MTEKSNTLLYTQRRKIIAEAAKVCFSRSGFHGGSISDLSKETGMGPGQLYRHYKSKTELINEVVRIIAAEWRNFLTERLIHLTELLHILDVQSPFWQGWSSQDHALLLEAYSEAARNKEVREILCKEELLLIETLCFRNKGKMKYSSNRIRLILIVIDGFLCRIFREEQLDLEELKKIESFLFEIE
ncbi:TetR/AcrR family transcriptional regulator [Rahnella sp. Larv3_ips]|uniref:TetR/AcrR family transcriptional regulator n=1 Tax=Rahnella sp. Larv3_ips TaxID=1896943 RepID=UPI0013CE4D05|nr:TetR/AcrR family transcriptional regulator [Rahnella sp. Larv3_ips]